MPISLASHQPPRPDGRCRPARRGPQPGAPRDPAGRRLARPSPEEFLGRPEAGQPRHAPAHVPGPQERPSADPQPGALSEVSAVLPLSFLVLLHELRYRRTWIVFSPMCVNVSHAFVVCHDI